MNFKLENLQAKYQNIIILEIFISHTVDLRRLLTLYIIEAKVYYKKQMLIISKNFIETDLNLLINSLKNIN